MNRISVTITQLAQASMTHAYLVKLAETYTSEQLPNIRLRCLLAARKLFAISYLCNELPCQKTPTVARGIAQLPCGPCSTPE